MKFRESQVHPVPDKVPIELHPLMAAFMSFFIIDIDNTTINRSRYVKRAIPMLWKLLCFMSPEFKSDKNIKSQISPSGRKEMLLRTIRKPNGTFMTPMEQFELFVTAAHQNGQDVRCYLIDKNSNRPIGGTSNNKSISTPIPILQLSEQKFAGTSLQFPFLNEK